MRRMFVCGVSLAISTASAPGGQVDPALREVLEQRPAGAPVSTLVYLADQTDLDALEAFVDAGPRSRQWRHEVAVRALQATAEAGQRDLLGELRRLAAEGRVERFRAYWIANAVNVVAAGEVIEAIAARADVDRVYYDFEISNIQPEVPATGRGAAPVGGVEPGIAAVRAPEVWALGITGAGALVATLDTGVDPDHPAVGTRWRGHDPLYQGHPEWAWFDPINHSTTPTAFASHGTHTMGTACGGAPGNQIGVAPGAEWIHAAVNAFGINEFISGVIESFEWMADPDGDPETVFDVPDGFSNSWGLADFHGIPDCDETFWSFMDACEAAGIVVIFSAGNEGFSGLRRPADRASDAYRSFAVGALNGNMPSYPIWSGSSRGPTNCTPGGQAAIKPDIAAPGENVVSALPGGGYGSMTGTSMASPHINGVVALMREADPDLAVDEIKQIIYDTALDLGAAREDNDYGWGLVDAFEAVQIVLRDTCPADLSGDGTVGTDDLLMLLSAWGPNPGHPADLDGNGTVSTFDLLMLLDAWGPCTL